MFNALLRVVNIREPVIVQTLVAKFAVKRFNECVWHGLAGLDEIENYSLFCRPRLSMLADPYFQILLRVDAMDALVINSVAVLAKLGMNPTVFKTPACLRQGYYLFPQLGIIRL
ncbi:MAG TPA: hypothetical protein V6D17_03765 [Candidatus Obscuribacterales bacterium]